MKKVLLLFVIITSFSINSKCQSVMFQKNDSSELKRLEKIEVSLSYFYKENRASQICLLVGGAITTAGAIWYKPQLNGPNVPVLFGGFISLSGIVLYLDSFSKLNIKKKKVTDFDNY